MHDPLVLNTNEERYPAPIRRDLRPMYGIFHATFVLARMLRVFTRLCKSGQELRYRDRTQLVRLQFEKGLGVVKEHGKLTARGEAIRDTFELCATSR